MTAWRDLFDHNGDDEEVLELLWAGELLAQHEYEEAKAEIAALGRTLSVKEANAAARGEPSCAVAA